jgi:hypothetical protein
MMGIIQLRGGSNAPPHERQGRHGPLAGGEGGDSRTGPADRVPKIRTEGMTRPGIADLMKEAGLTHGGFYKHFDSRDDLIAQAAAVALAEGSAKMERAARKNDQDARAGLVDAYLAKQHRDGPATGCAPVSLGAAAGRGDQPLKEAYEKQVRTHLELIAGLDGYVEDARRCLDRSYCQALKSPRCLCCAGVGQLHLEHGRRHVTR